MKYVVTGTITLNWSITVDADSEDDAERIAKSYAEDGHGLGIPVDEAMVDDVEEIEA